MSNWPYKIRYNNITKRMITQKTIIGIYMVGVGNFGIPIKMYLYKCSLVPMRFFALRNVF